MEMAQSGAGVLTGGDVELHLLVYRRSLANDYLSSENSVTIALYICSCPIHPSMPQPAHSSTIQCPSTLLCFLLLALLNAANAMFYRQDNYTSVHNTALAPGLPIDQT